MTPKTKTIRIRPPLHPPPDDMNWRLATDANGYQFYIVWAKGKTFAQAAAPLLTDIYHFNVRQREEAAHKAAQ